MIFRLFKLLVPVFFCAIVLNANTVSNLKGELSVEQGSLNYNIPLNLPAGSAGVKPELSLVYNSNGANGYFGAGWNLSGLSSITRCASNLALDNKIRGIKYDNSDNICLDGQRLVLVSGNRWGYNSEYRTKIDSYSKIVYKGSNFTVYTKSGDIKAYTKKNNAWLLTGIKDRFGNKITYTYAATSNEIYLREIAYSDNKVKFAYGDKTDSRFIYSNTKGISLNKRVTSITVTSGRSELRKYYLNYYNQDSGADVSLIKEIKECSNNECLKPLVFKYDTPNKTFNSSKFWINSFGAEWKTRPSHISGRHTMLIDMNGDGLPIRYLTGTRIMKAGGFM